jgi:DTW domain-containing protein YfiP
VLQHPDEVRHAKNSARLVGLVNPGTELVVGETAEDFKVLRDRFDMDSRAVVLYPASGSAALGDSVSVEPIETIIIIDGTWRKAKRMWLTNPWLHRLRVYHLNDVGSSVYSIRASSVSGGLASIEAAAHALGVVEDTSTQPLWDAFAAMQANWPD